PAIAIDEVVPVGDQVAERAAGVAERHAAVHAARALLLQLGHRQQHDELLEVLDALVLGALARVDPLDLQEAAELTHSRGAPPPRPPPRPGPSRPRSRLSRGRPCPPARPPWRRPRA